MTEQNTTNQPNVNATQKRSKRNERGASLVEYALLVGLIAVAAIAAMRVFGTQVSTQFSSIATQLGATAS